MGKSKEIKSSKSLESKSVEENSSSSSSINKWTWPIVVLLVAIVVYLWKGRSGGSPLKDLTSASVSELKSSIFGDVPHLYYCDRRSSGEDIPSSLLALNGKSNDLGFAMVNCSQTVSGGVSLWDKFKLKKGVRPSVFASAPWMRIKQIPLESLKSTTTLQKFIDTHMKPKVPFSSNDQDFSKYCAFDGSNKTQSPTCIVIIRGSKYSNTQEKIEESLIRKFPRVKFTKISSKGADLSFEKGLSTVPSPADYAMRVYAIREGQYYLPMSYSPTLEYMETFIGSAVHAPTSEFTAVSGKAVSGRTIQLIKRNTGFKTRGSSSSSSSNDNDHVDKETLERIEEARRKRDLKRKERREREMQRLEELEEESRSHLFEAEADEGVIDEHKDEEEEDEVGEDEEEDEVIDL